MSKPPTLDDRRPRPHLRSPNTWELCDPADCKHFGNTGDLRQPIQIVFGPGLFLLGLAGGAALIHDTFVVRFALVAEVPIIIAGLLLGLGFFAKPQK
jgi:hypothetical protein